MLANLDDDKYIPCRTTVYSWLSFTCEAYLLTVVNTCRNRHFNSRMFLYCSATTTCVTFISDVLPYTLAIITCALIYNFTKGGTLLHMNLTSTVTMLTSSWTCARFCS